MSYRLAAKRTEQKLVKETRTWVLKGDAENATKENTELANAVPKTWVENAGLENGEKEK